MESNLYQLDGHVSKKITVSELFTKEFRVDLVRRALLAEQSLRYQPQAHSPMAGMNTTATYVGEYSTYRTGRHMGMAIRPRQKLGGGAMGDVRRIPSSTKGRRAHPHKLEKIIVERMNVGEYKKALESAVAATASESLVAQRHTFKNLSLPMVVENEIEGLSKTKELIKVLKSIGLSNDLSRSHDPRIKKGAGRTSRQRHYRKSVLIVVKEGSRVQLAGRNIPGVDVIGVNNLSVEKLAPGALPRLTIWSENAVNALESAVKNARL